MVVRGSSRWQGWSPALDKIWGAGGGLTTGGTGIGPRDLTVDVVAKLCVYEVPGIAEEIRRMSAGAVPGRRSIPSA